MSSSGRVEISVFFFLELDLKILRRKGELFLNLAGTAAIYGCESIEYLFGNAIWKRMLSARLEHKSVQFPCRHNGCYSGLFFGHATSQYVKL